MGMCISKSSMYLKKTLQFTIIYQNEQKQAIGDVNKLLDELGEKLQLGLSDLKKIRKIIGKKTCNSFFHLLKLIIL